LQFVPELAVLSLVMAAMMFAAADTPASAGAAAPAAATAPQPEKKKGSELVCWEEAPTGSHFTKRVCMTRQDLEARQQQDQDAVGQRGRNTPGGFGASGGGPGGGSPR
jgi:invasion protein IalB